MHEDIFLAVGPMAHLILFYPIVCLALILFGALKYLDQEEKVIYTAKDKKTSKVYPALEWLAKLCSHIPNRCGQMVRCYGCRNTVRRYSSAGNPHFNSKSKTIDLVKPAIPSFRRSRIIFERIFYCCLPELND